MAGEVYLLPPPEHLAVIIWLAYNNPSKANDDVRNCHRAIMKSHFDDLELPRWMDIMKGCYYAEINLINGNEN